MVYFAIFHANEKLVKMFDIFCDIPRKMQDLSKCVVYFVIYHGWWNNALKWQIITYTLKPSETISLMMMFVLKLRNEGIILSFPSHITTGNEIFNFPWYILWYSTQSEKIVKMRGIFCDIPRKMKNLSKCVVYFVIYHGWWNNALQ